jgi:hypothetical protein
LNNNGSSETSEPGLTGRTVFVDYDDDGALDANEPSTITSTFGNWRLGAAPGTWRVRVLAGNDYAFNVQGGSYAPFTFGTRNALVLGNLGMVDNRPTRGQGAITGLVFEDSNRNGRHDPGERGAVGHTVYVDANNNGVLDAGEVSTASDPSGRYALVDLTSGATYTVREVAPAGWTGVFVGNTGANSVTLGSGPYTGVLNVASFPIGAPTVADVQLDFETAQKLTFTFDRDVRGSLGAGDFVVETDAGFLDGRITTQLAEAARMLAEPTS